MYRKSFSLLVGTGVCAALALATIGRPAWAAEPETQSITFALVFVYTGLEGDPSQLSDYIGADTIGILLGSLQDTATDTLTFAGDSPPCDSVPVAGTQWTMRALPVTLLNKGGPLWGDRLASPAGEPLPPQHSLVRATEISVVHACWLKFNGSSQAYVQESPDGYTERALFIITANFPVKN